MTPHALAGLLGLPVEPEGMDEAGYCPWTGSTMVGRDRRGERFEDRELWHELGHALVAHPLGRNLRGWGMGKVYDGTDGGPVLEQEAGSPSESDASALGVVLHADLGGGNVLGHCHEHGWRDVADARKWVAQMRPVAKKRAQERMAAAGVVVGWDTP